jgi:DNA polymerase-3 subunit gamma/tau
MSRFRFKYRPTNFSEAWGIDYLKEPLRRMIENERYNSILIKGEYGTGKTTFAKTLLARIYCENPSGIDPCLNCYNCQTILTGEGSLDSWLLPGSKIDDSLLDKINESFYYCSWIFKKRCLFVDDLEYMPSKLMIKLIHLLNKHEDEVVIFTASNLDNFPPPLIQRLNIIEIVKPHHDELYKFCEWICKSEQIDIATPEAISDLVNLADSNFRNILNILEKVKDTSGKLTPDVLSSPLILANTGTLVNKNKIIKIHGE